MKTPNKRWYLLFFLLFTILGCAGGANLEELIGEAGAVIEEAIMTAIDEAVAEYGIDIPTDKVREIEFSDGALNMLVEAEFDALVLLMKTNALKGGLSEREMSTEISEGSATMIFDGHDSGLATIITLTDEGDGLVRVRISLLDT